MAEGLKMSSEQDGPPTSMNLASPENFSQVAFSNIDHYYPLNTDIQCSFQILKGFQSGTRDWVGIFKVGWQTTKEYYTWISASSGQGHVLFKAYYLPKDEEFYQFCYVDNNGEVRGISVPFQFRAEDASEFVLMTTEEEMEKKNEEKRILEKEKEAQAMVIQLLQTEVRNTSEMIEKTKKENQDLQLQLKSLEEENRELKKNTCELEHHKTKEQELLSEIKEMNMCKEEMEAEIKELQRENMAKQQALENTSSLMKERASLKAEFEALKDTLESERKLKTNLQDSLAIENKKLVNEENKSKELQKQLISARERMATLEQKVASLESENVAKGEEEKKLCANIAHLEFEVTTLRDGSKEQLKIIEKEKREKGSLEEIMDRQNKKVLHAEEKLRELQTAKQKIATLEQKVALLENQNKKKTEEVQALQDALELRREEFQDLNTARLRSIEEIEELNRQLRQAQLSAATSPVRPFPLQATGLLYGNPYEETHPDIVRENEPMRSFETTLFQENRPPPSVLTCPICYEEFPSGDYQVYEDHVMCHSHEEATPPQQQEMKCEICNQFVGDVQMYNDHMMCHRLEEQSG